MRLLTCFASFFLLVLPFVSRSQPPIADIRPVLKSLSIDQKSQVLEYLRRFGDGMDDEIQRVYAQSPKNAQAQTALLVDWFRQQKKQPQLAAVRMDRDTFFFHDVSEGTPVAASFEITNDGTTPYIIAAHKTTCDCTVLKMPQYPIMPGEKAVLRVEFDTSGKLGTATPAVILYDNSTPNQRHILYLKGNISARNKPRKYPWND
ncbi:MAG: DUF1573 domain-containing protein [Saprospiraceae bacterium]